MGLYFRWTDAKSEDLANYKQKKLTYTWKGSPSRKAFWVIAEKSEYKPDVGVSKDRLLLVFDFGPDGDAIITNKMYHLDFESSKFKGEAQHPTLIIVKNNEKGGYGIGTTVRESLKVKDIRLATKKEMAWALGKKEVEIKLHQKW